MKALLLALLVAVIGFGCGEATRATVHQEDMVKVFPWPTHQAKATIRAKPQTTAANMCIWLGSYQEIEVTPDTTFYLLDETEQHFAYTPARSPMRRLAKIKFMEIRWPVKETASSEPAKVENDAKPVKETKEAKESKGAKESNGSEGSQ